MTTGALTIQDNDTVEQYTSVGESAFIYSFPILAAAELRVSVDQVDKTNGVDYTVSGIGDSGGGTVTFTAPTVAGSLITIWQDMPIERTTGFSAGAATIQGAALNAEFSARLRVEQQLRREIRNSWRLAPDDPIAGQDMEIAPVATRKGKYLFANAITGALEWVTSLVTTVFSQQIFNQYNLGADDAQPRQLRGAFTLPATLKFFGDSFWEEPNAHTSSTHSMAYKAAVLLGRASSIDATSGNSSADKQDAIFAANPTAADAWFNNLGQNDVQFVGTGADVEQRINDIALIQLANLLQIATPAGGRRYLASTFTQSGGSAWTNDAEIPEGGAVKSNTITDTLLCEVLDSGVVAVIFKVKNASGGKFSVVIDGTSHPCPIDPTGFHSAPLGNIPTNTGKTFARQALLFNLGRRKPRTVVQIVVTSPTNVANVVSICSVIGLPGIYGETPLLGPLATICDLSDRGAAGYATAPGSQSALQKISRMISLLAGIGQACGLRICHVPLSQALDINTDLAGDEFHPSETGANKGAAAIAAVVTAAARDLSTVRPDLDAQMLVMGADGYVLMGGAGLQLGTDYIPKRHLQDPKHIDWSAARAVPTPDSIRIVFKDGSDQYNLLHALYLSRTSGDAGDAIVGNSGNGQFSFMAYGSVRMNITTTGIISPATHSLAPQTDDRLQLGAASKRFVTAWFSQYAVTSPVTVATLPAAGGSIEGARWAVTDSNAASFTAGIGAVVAGGGTTHVPVYCDGTNWRIG